MKLKTMLSYAVAALPLTLLIGCNPSNDETLTQTDETNQLQISQAESDESKINKDLDAYTYAQKSQFISEMNTELANIKGSINELALKVDSADKETKATVTPRLNELRNQAALLEEHISEVKDTTSATWEESRSTTSETYANLKDNYNNASEWIDNKTNT